jgi:hypothetical protein
MSVDVNGSVAIFVVYIQFTLTNITKIFIQRFMFHSVRKKKLYQYKKYLQLQNFYYSTSVDDRITK